MSNETDMVNHPPHYTSHPSGIEAITVCKHLDFCLGNTFKYLFRFTSNYPKGGSPNIEDLRKAKFYLDQRIAIEESKP
jgi:hypothetical protein